MVPKPRYHIIAPKNKVYYCQLTRLKSGEEDIYSFLVEETGDRMNIKKTNNIWAYASGSELWKDWTKELGAQIASGGFI